MSVPETSAQIVARFLRSNHYNETLEAFIKEAGLPEDAGTLSPGAWTVEQILQEKIQFDTSIKFEKYGKNEKQGWTTPAPNTFCEPKVGVNSNVLCVNSNISSDSITVTSADRSLRSFTAVAPYTGEADLVKIGDSPVLSTVFVPGGLLLTTSMSGHLSLRKADSLALIDRCRHHSKYTVQVVSHLSGGVWFIATAAWDQKIHVYAPDTSQLTSINSEADTDDEAILPGYLGEPIHTISLTSNPESMVFVRHPDTDVIYLVASRRDSTHLYYYRLEKDSAGKVTVQEAGRQNLAPHSNAWIAFTPCSLAMCPTDPTLIATATSHLPHMKLIIARLLFPDMRKGRDPASIEQPTQASVARDELALQDHEDAAINIQVTTMAPQTPYSTPQVAWRPDGSGLFVNGDDGVVRGVETSSGKVVSLLKGHEIGSKVRTLWAGYVNADDTGSGQEILISGGFDKKLLIWTSAAEL